MPREVVFRSLYSPIGLHFLDSHVIKILHRRSLQSTIFRTGLGMVLSGYPAYTVEVKGRAAWVYIMSSIFQVGSP